MHASTRYTFEGTAPPAGVPQACPHPSRLAFLGCGFITRVHSRTCGPWAAWSRVSYASRDRAKADAFCREFGGARRLRPTTPPRSPIPEVDAVVVAVPPAFH